MFHVKHILVFLFIIASVGSAMAQGTVELRDNEFVVSRARNGEIDNYLKKFDFLKTLQPEEREIFYWVNVLRTDPGGFLETYVEPFLIQFPEAKGAGSRSL